MERSSVERMIFDMASSYVQFVQCNQDQYTGLEVKDSNALYFVIDKQKIYKGDSLVSSINVKFGTDAPSRDNVPAGILYVYQNTSEGNKITLWANNGTSPVQVGGGEATDIADGVITIEKFSPGLVATTLDDPNDQTIPTTKAVVDKITSALDKSNGTVWTESQKKVIFSSITQQTYDGVSQKNADTLYFITDTRKIYKGDVDVTSSVIVGEIPEVGSAIKGKLYINPTSLEAKVTTDGASFITMSPGYLTDGANWSSADSNKLATIGLIKKGIQETLSGINTNASFSQEDGTLTVGSGTPATLTGVAHDIKYESAQLKITIPVYGGPDVVVNIPKDKFVTAGKYYKDYPEEEPTQHNVIVLTIDNQDEPVIIPAEGLVDVFTGGSTDNITVKVSDSNQITATVTIDSAEGNALVSSASGLKVDVSNKLNTYGSGNASEILLSDAEGNVPSRSGVSIISGTGPMGNEDTKIPTAKLIAEAITTAINSSIGSKVDKVVGTEDNLVAFSAGGAIKDSGKKVGGATLSESPDENTLATELAVASAFSWKTLD